MILSEEAIGVAKSHKGKEKKKNFRTLYKIGLNITRGEG